jgi:hypothetical protein
MTSEAREALYMKLLAEAERVLVRILREAQAKYEEKKRRESC